MAEVERGLRTVGKAVGVRAGHGACLPISNELQAYTSPYRPLAIGPIWYEKSVKEWEVKEDQAHVG
jgi:hypothetical protein